MSLEHILQAWQDDLMGEAYDPDDATLDDMQMQQFYDTMERHNMERVKTKADAVLLAQDLSQMEEYAKKELFSVYPPRDGYNAKDGISGTPIPGSVRLERIYEGLAERLSVTAPFGYDTDAAVSDLKSGEYGRYIDDVNTYAESFGFLPKNPRLSLSSFLSDKTARMEPITKQDVKDIREAVLMEQDAAFKARMEMEADASLYYDKADKSDITRLEYGYELNTRIDPSDLPVFLREDIYPGPSSELRAMGDAGVSQAAKIYDECMEDLYAKVYDLAHYDASLLPSAVTGGKHPVLIETKTLESLGEGYKVYQINRMESELLERGEKSASPVDFSKSMAFTGGLLPKAPEKSAEAKKKPLRHADKSVEAKQSPVRTPLRRAAKPTARRDLSELALDTPEGFELEAAGGV